MNENPYSKKMASKSYDELLEIVDDQGSKYVAEAVNAARLELEKRNPKGEIPKSKDDFGPIKKGEELYKDFIKSIKKVPRFEWIPKYSESIKTNVSYEDISQLAIQVFKKLEWTVIYESIQCVAAYRKNRLGYHREEIIVSIEKSGSIHIHSKSLENRIWDRGLNSLNVKLFIHVFEETNASR